MREWFSMPGEPNDNRLSSYYYYPIFGGSLVRIRLELGRTNTNQHDDGCPCISVTSNTVVGFANVAIVNMYHNEGCYFFVDTTNHTIYALRRFSKYNELHDRILKENLINKYSDKTVIENLKDPKKSSETLLNIKTEFSTSFKRDYLRFVDHNNLLYRLETSPGKTGNLYTIDFEFSNNGIHRNFVHTGLSAVETNPNFPVYRSQNREIQITQAHLNTIAQSYVNSPAYSYKLINSTANTPENQNALAHKILELSGINLTATEEQ